MKTRITNYIRAGNPGLYILSAEEARVELELAAVAAGLRRFERDAEGNVRYRDDTYQLYTWSVTQGIIQSNGQERVKISDTEAPDAMLDAFAKLEEQSILIARDFHLFLKEPNPFLIRKVKDALLIGKNSNRHLVILGCALHLPPELEKEIVVLEMKLPDREQLKLVAQGIATSAAFVLNGSLDAILDAASGLTTTEAECAFALSVVETKQSSPEGLPEIKASIVAREKANTVRKNGILEIVETKLGINDIGGMETRKAWLSKRRDTFSQKAKDYGLPTPKGEMNIGVPGCGKSLGAKVTANSLGVPLLKLDAGKIFGSLVGESERNLRTAIATAEAIAPCVLWIDEIEKGLAGSKSSGSTDGGTTSRVFGTFLQWLQEKTAPVYVYATANDISQLPPEFMRKGRFDEIWFLDLPDESERQAIWQIHISKRGRNPEQYDLARLSQATNGFTGAEIEAAFTESLFAAFDEGVQPGDQHILAAIAATIPLSRTMAAEIEGLRTWANGRARRASPLKNLAEAPKSGYRKFA